MAIQPTKPETIAITNFSGRLTRIVNGDLNSGFAKFTTSFGYDPFSKPMNLTWLPGVQDITGNVTDLILSGKMNFESDFINYLYAIGHTGNLYKIQPISQTNNNLNTTSVIGKITNNSPTFNFGASMEFFSSPSSVASQIYISNDLQVNAVNFDGSGDHKVGGTGYLANSYKPLKRFLGKLYFGNGNTIGAIDSTGTVTSSVIGTGQGNLYSELNPPLPADVSIHDMEKSDDGNYLRLASSGITYEKLTTTDYNLYPSNVTEGQVSGFNGIDQSITTNQSLGNSPVQSLEVYLNSNYFFSQDTFGTSISDGINKILTLPNNKPPLPNAICVNGNFITWACVEKDRFNRLCASLYYYGSLDQENPPGLYRIFRRISGPPNYTYQVPFNTVVSAYSTTLNTSESSVITASLGKHYLSTLEFDSTSSIISLLQIAVAGDTTSQTSGGFYETQTQLFSKKIQVKQVRVYTEPTVAGNAFGIDLIGSDGSTITNGSMSYTFVAGSDETKMQGSLERINFNPSVENTYALGLSITDNGSTNMTIKKIEIDYVYAGK